LIQIANGCGVVTWSTARISNLHNHKTHSRHVGHQERNCIYHVKNKTFSY